MRRAKTADLARKRGEAARPVILPKTCSRRFLLAAPLTTTRRPSGDRLARGVTEGKPSRATPSQLRHLGGERFVRKIGRPEAGALAAVRNEGGRVAFG